MKHAPIPMEALRDPELSATDFRILGAIASHDRLGRNGRGCFASMGTLAREALCGLRSAERSIARLKDRGYVRSERSRADGRQSVLRVVYREDNEIPANSGGNLAPDTRQSDPNYPPTQFGFQEQDQWLGEGKHSSKHIPTIGEANPENRHHSYRSGAQPKPSAGRLKNARNDGAWLRMVQDELSEPYVDYGRLAELYDDLTDLLDTTTYGDGLDGWAKGIQDRVISALYEIGCFDEYEGPRRVPA